MKNLVQQLKSLNPAPGELPFCHMGQHSFLFQFGRVTVGCDLFLSPLPDRLIPPQMKWEDLAEIDFLTGSHNHADHIDLPLWAKAAEHFPHLRFVLPRAVEAPVRQETRIPRERLIPLNDGESLELSGVTLHAVAAAHEFLDRDPVSGCYPYLGYVMTGNGFTLYHAGDCCPYPGLTERLRRFRCDAAFLPINGRDAGRLKQNCIGNFTYWEAGDLASWIGAGTVIPAHYDMFAMNLGDPEAFRDYMNTKYPAVSVVIPRTGRVQILRKSS